MANTNCKYVVFIMNEVNEIEEEMDMWTKEFKKYFVVKKVENYSEAVKFIRDKYNLYLWIICHRK
jgi:glycerol-3-phosphate responsive antiterminator